MYEKKNFPPGSLNILTFLRTREGLSQKEPSGKLGMKPMVISNMERFGPASMDKAIRVARFFGITVDAALTNDMEAVASTFTAPVKANHKTSFQMEKLSIRRIKLGRQGEDWVYRHELERLQDTPYRNAVNPNFANDLNAGFDILSFDRDGTPKRLEVKTTTGHADKPFTLTENELQTLRDCVSKGLSYEIYRVYDFRRSPKVLVISGEELLREFCLTPCVSYDVTRKGAA